nr:PREDICTED: uncharacterized protein LOC109039155 [Bemisia tabaci]
MAFLNYSLAGSAYQNAPIDYGVSQPLPFTPPPAAYDNGFQQAPPRPTPLPVPPQIPQFRTPSRDVPGPEPGGSNRSSTFQRAKAAIPTGFYKQISPGGGSKTSVHAVIDYDDDFGEGDLGNGVGPGPGGPIALRGNSTPVVPRYAYDVYNTNGTLIQIPILWTALSLALGYEVRGDLIRGLPCIKRNHQLFCPTAGNRYPAEEIERFIDENKALVKRMYGEFESTPYGQSASQPSPGQETFEPYPRTKRKTGTKWKSDADWGGTPAPGPDIQGSSPADAKSRYSRQAPKNPPKDDSGRVDACQSKLEIITPYWASNSAGKVRAIVNTQHFEQSVHQETCSRASTGRCAKDCGCEQKYKWHRLMAYDPDNDCKGIFMDWFLFPSCCVCRCNPL